jgi:hypothetical protein
MYISIRVVYNKYVVDLLSGGQGEHVRLRPEVDADGVPLGAGAPAEARQGLVITSHPLPVLLHITNYITKLISYNLKLH